MVSMLAPSLIGAHATLSVYAGASDLAVGQDMNVRRNFSLSSQPIGQGSRKKLPRSLFLPCSSQFYSCSFTKETLASMLTHLQTACCQHCSNFTMCAASLSLHNVWARATRSFTVRYQLLGGTRGHSWFNCTSCVLLLSPRPLPQFSEYSLHNHTSQWAKFGTCCARYDPHAPLSHPEAGHHRHRVAPQPTPRRHRQQAIGRTASPGHRRHHHHPRLVRLPLYPYSHSLFHWKLMSMHPSMCVRRKKSITTSIFGYMQRPQLMRPCSTSRNGYPWKNQTGSGMIWALHWTHD